MDVDLNANYLSDLAGFMEGEELEVRHCAGDHFVTFYSDNGYHKAALVLLQRRQTEEPNKMVLGYSYLHKLE
jgi:hypothetical protein